MCVCNVDFVVLPLKKRVPFFHFKDFISINIGAFFSYSVLYIGG